MIWESKGCLLPWCIIRESRRVVVDSFLPMNKCFVSIGVKLFRSFFSRTCLMGERERNGTYTGSFSLENLLKFWNSLVWNSLYLGGFLICAYFMIYKMALINKAQIPVRLVSDFITYCAIGILVGGLIGHAFFYSPDLLTQFKSELPFWGVFAVNEGGMASHGGMIGLFVACFLFARAHRLNLLHLLDWVCICGPIGIFFWTNCQLYQWRISWEAECS